MADLIRKEPIHQETTSAKDLDTPIADSFRSIENLPDPEMDADLLRKRQKVKRA